MKTQIETADFADDADFFLVITLHAKHGSANLSNHRRSNRGPQGVGERICRAGLPRGSQDRIRSARHRICSRGSHADLLSSVYRADFLCLGSIIVELKALREVGKNEYAKVINYLNAAKLTRGLLINYGSASLEYRRFILSKYESA